MQSGMTTLENSFLKVKHIFILWPRNLTPRYLPMRNEILCYTESCVKMLKVALFINVPNWKWPKYSPVGKLLNTCGTSIEQAAAAAAKLYQTLCNPIDWGILQARTLEWAAISFSNAGKVKSESKVAQSCLTLSDPLDCSPPGSSVHGIFQARVLEWGAIAFSLEQATTQHKKECTTDTWMTQMNLRCIIWSKISQVQKTASVGVSFIWYLKRQNISDRNQIS